MGLFRTPKPDPAPVPEPVEPPPPDLVERVAALERQFQGLMQEWSDTLDRITRHFARESARRRQRLHRDMESLAESPEDAPGPTNSGQGGEISPQDRKAALRAAVNAQRLRRA